MSDKTPYTPSEKMVRRGWIDYRVAQDEADAWVISEDDSPVAEFDRFIARVRRDAKAEAILMDGFDVAVADLLADAGYTEYAEDEDGGVTWVSAPLGEVLHIVRICATEYETGDRA